MADSRAAVAAVIVNWNAGPTLITCVQRLRDEGVAEVVVVDNASSDGSPNALAAADPDVRLISAGANLGLGAATNRGVATTRANGNAPYLLILNPDAIVEPGAVKALTAALERDPDLALVGPRIENPDGSPYPSARRFPDLGVAAGHAFLGFVAPNNRWSRAYKRTDVDGDRSRAADVDWVSGSCFLARRPAFEAVGGFDESFFMYCEDVDLCWRLGQAGWRVGFEPAARVMHIGAVSTNQTPYRMIREHHRSVWRFARRSTTGLRRLALPAIRVGLTARLGLAWAQRAKEDAAARAPRKRGTN